MLQLQHPDYQVHPNNELVSSQQQITDMDTNDLNTVELNNSVTKLPLQILLEEKQLAT
jgi:hypothetical protein